MENETAGSVRILAVDDEADMLRICREVLTSDLDVGDGVPSITTASDGNQAKEAILSDTFDLILLDVRMPGVKGLELMHFALEHGRGAPVVLMTAYPNYSDAVTATKEGAHDYVVKPFTANQLLEVAKNALREEHERVPSTPTGAAGGSRLPADAFLGENAAVREIRSLAKRVARLRENVVLLGETGTGKGLIARIVHACGPHPASPMVTLDCGAIPRELMESQLFGHERGAFTNAHKARTGVLESAGRGTLFLDEVSEIPLDLQSRLLRALQEREFRAVGGSRVKRFEARVIAASNRDLLQEVKKKLFREDLYYRLHVIPIHLPALREHPEDIRLLATAMLTRFNEQNPIWKVRSVSPRAMDVLSRYRWPGNVRELENVIRRAAAFAGGEQIGVEDLPEELMEDPNEGGNTMGGNDFARARETWLSRFEQRYFGSLLEECGGNVVEAARASGVPRATLYRYLRKHDLNPVDFRVSGAGLDPADETVD